MANKKKIETTVVTILLWEDLSNSYKSRIVENLIRTALTDHDIAIDNITITPIDEKYEDTRGKLVNVANEILRIVREEI